jgi:cell division protein FtsB
MKTEWLLNKLDDEVRAYTELRRQLAAATPDSDEYNHTEADLHIQITRLKTEAISVLDAIEEADT